MASAAFVTEFRSFVSFECEAASTEYLNLKRFNEAGQRMAPLQEIPRLLNEKKMEDETPSVRKQESPMSSPGTSAESASGSPASQPSEGPTDISSRMVYNPSSEESNGMENGSDHLKRMEDVLEKTGIFGQNPPCNTYEVNGVDSDDDEFTYDLNDSRTTIPKCHFCGYAADTKDQYNMHIHGHFPYKCADCSYMARTKGRLENHMKNHREVPDSYWQDLSPENGRGIAGNGDLSPPLDDEPRGSKKDRVTKCKHCSFVGISKSELYAHLRQRICFTGPLLECDFEKKNGARCDFCTQYKHHLEYHLRNHFGSKPFKCHQCKYTCVNQSMLNSHMKSHSNDYPYRCKTCTYATKYLHSLKMHLKKYDHEPDKVLNADGTVNNDLIIDVNGRRRGPKSKRAKTSSTDSTRNASTSSASPPLQHPGHPATGYNPSTSLPSLHPSFVYNTPMFNNMSSNGFFPPPFFDPAMAFRFSSPMNMDTGMRCHFPNCEYVADSSQSLHQHLSIHMMHNYQDSLGMNPVMFPQRRNFVSENKPGAHFQNEIEHAPRTQASNDSYLRSKDHHVARSSGAFKYSSKVEMEMRARVSPPLSNGTFPYEGRYVEGTMGFANQDLHHKKIQELKKVSLNENINKMKLVSSESSSLSPPSTEHVTACSSSSSNDSYDAEWDCTSPMDLTKNLSPKPKVFNGVINKLEPPSKRQHIQQTAEPVSIQPQRTVKNRRKGKAFKIDHYMQYEDQSTEFSNVESQIPKEQPSSMAIKMEAEDLSLSPPRMNGEIQEFHSKNAERVPTPKRIKSSPEPSFQIPSNHCSTPKVATARNDHSKRNVVVGESASRSYNGSYDQGIYMENGIQTEKRTLVRPSLNGRDNRDRNGMQRHAFTSPNTSDTSDQKNNKQETNDKHTCPHCEIGFMDFVMLALHMTCHTVGAPFVCNKCNEDCKDRVNFMYHMINNCKRS